MDIVSNRRNSYQLGPFPASTPLCGREFKSAGCYGEAGSKTHGHTCWGGFLLLSDDENISQLWLSWGPNHMLDQSSDQQRQRKASEMNTGKSCELHEEYDEVLDGHRQWTMQSDPGASCTVHKGTDGPNWLSIGTSKKYCVFFLPQYPMLVFMWASTNILTKLTPRYYYLPEVFAQFLAQKHQVLSPHRKIYHQKFPA